jgi:quercetin dioxygenase-like cupin family protein
MAQEVRPVVVRTADRPRETWDDPTRGDISWFTLISGDLTPSNTFSAGIAELEPGGSLAPHRHAEPEIYCILEGSCTVTIDGTDHGAGVGTVVFIPGNAEHGIHNESSRRTRLFYVFATDRFSDVVYRFGS